MDSKLLIIIVCSFIGFMLPLLGKDRLAVCYVVFSIPFNVFPFSRADLFFSPFHFVILSVWLGVILRKGVDRNFIVRQWPRIRLWPLYTILIIGAVMPLVTDGAYLDKFITMDPSIQVLNQSCNIIALILLILLLQYYRNDRDSLHKFMASFTLTSFPTFISLLIIKSGYSNLFPTYLVAGGEEVVNSSWRFSTFVGGAQETALYAMFVIVFAALNLLQDKYYKLSVSVIIISPIIGFASGSRSFFFMLTILAAITVFTTFIMYITHRISFGSYYNKSTPKISRNPLTPNTGNTVRNKNKSIPILFVIVILVCSSWFAITKMNFTESLSRVAYGVESFERSGRLTDATEGRDPIGKFQEILWASGLLGNGSLVFATMNYDLTVGHNSFLNIMAKYGVFGLFLLVRFLLRWLSYIIALLSNRMTSMDALSLAVVFASLIAMIGQEMTFCSTNKVGCFLPYIMLSFFVWSFSKKLHYPIKKLQTNSIE